MALPGSGTIWFSQLRDEFGDWGPPNWMSHYYRGALTTTNNLNVPTDGPIWMSQFHGAVKAHPGSASYGPGTHHMGIPPFQWMTIDVRGGGGGGGGANVDVLPGSAGLKGGDSHVYNAGADVWAGGGAGGAGSNYYAGVNYPSGNPQAGAGGGNHGGQGGAGGNGGAYALTHGQRGGNGGRHVITYYPGQLVVGGTLTIVVGSGGGHGGGGTSGIQNGGNGAVYISWG